MLDADGAKQPASVPSNHRADPVRRDVERFTLSSVVRYVAASGWDVPAAAMLPSANRRTLVVMSPTWENSLKLKCPRQRPPRGAK